MRLRYLHLPGESHPPLRDIRIVFGQENVLRRACAIRFVVGVNGTGKTRLLQVLTSLFLELERPRLPRIPVTLIYDLGRGADARTVLVHVPEEGGGVLVELALQDDRSEVAWDDLANTDWSQPDVLPDFVRRVFTAGDLPGGGAIGAFLPRVLLVYTSGDLTEWRRTFAPPTAAGATAALPALSAPEEEPVDERPPGWTTVDEAALQREQGEASDVAAAKPELDRPAENVSTIGQLVTGQELPLAVFATALRLIVDEWAEGLSREHVVARLAAAEAENRRLPGLRGLFSEVDWLWPESVHFRVNFAAARTNPAAAQELERWSTLQSLSTTAVRQPGPEDVQLLNFDLFRLHKQSTGQLTAQVLFEELAGSNGVPFDLFQRLRSALASGLLQTVQMTVRKRDAEDLLLYDWLSDGERMFLGRMALFHLLANNGNTLAKRDDALMILDEPETHFNDVWKREIVDIIDDSLRHESNDVVISMHSSIGLTDVFDTEITLLRKGTEGTVAVVRTPIQTFGASPSEIMWGIYEAEEVVGQRATEFLDTVLMVAGMPDAVDSIWASPRDEWTSQPSFQALLTHIQQLRHTNQTEEQLQKYLTELLENVQSYTAQTTREHRVTAVSALEALQDRLGPGAYQFEFRRRLRALRNRNSNASPSQSPRL
jgi:ABC-type hemin transport system ATPase subunit